ncbi:hypothetical protein AQUCO_09500043v1 [Aquilegia coerulea]|uniref:RING-type domain-containing protein n=1 Tax=Aquilegia coerulea TaxID=218851 RepID=A0A2G5C4T0_AQUCA|nr:hypothetical protein AQUCO_09500043v1 [Aquilegia coerulea]
MEAIRLDRTYEDSLVFHTVNHNHVGTNTILTEVDFRRCTYFLKLEFLILNDYAREFCSTRRQRPRQHPDFVVGLARAAIARAQERRIPLMRTEAAVQTQIRNMLRFDRSMTRYNCYRCHIANVTCDVFMNCSNCNNSYIVEMPSETVVHLRNILWAHRYLVLRGLCRVNINPKSHLHILEFWRIRLNTEIPELIFEGPSPYDDFPIHTITEEEERELCFICQVYFRRDNQVRRMNNCDHKLHTLCLKVSLEHNVTICGLCRQPIV